VLDIVKSLEKQGAKGKMSVIMESVVGPQREEMPQMYASHTPGADGEESLEYFSTTGLADREEAIRCTNLVLPQLRSHPGAVLEVECVIATVIAGQWASAKGVPPIDDSDVILKKA